MSKTHIAAKFGVSRIPSVHRIVAKLKLSRREDWKLWLKKGLTTFPKRPTNNQDNRTKPVVKHGCRSSRRCSLSAVSSSETTTTLRGRLRRFGRKATAEEKTVKGHFENDFFHAKLIKKMIP